MKRTAIVLVTATVAAGLTSIAAAENQVGAANPPSPAVSPVPVVPGTPATPAAKQASPASPGQKAPAVADLGEIQKARAALDELIRAYETGNLALLQARLDPAMIGYQRLVDGAREDANRLKQIRIHLFDIETTIGPDVAVIQSNWEKRFIDVVTFRPGQFSGNSKFLLQRKPTGWTVIAFAGDNLFSSASGSVGQLKVNGGAATLALPAIADVLVPVSFELIDPDLAGSRSVTIGATITSGDRENITLTETTPGRFTSTMQIRRRATPSLGDGILDAITPATLILRYVDRNPGNNRPSSTVNLAISIR